MKGARGMFTRTGYEQSQWNIPLTPFARGILSVSQSLSSYLKGYSYFNNWK